MPVENFDAIVIGSGISGGWAAKELTEKGLNVLMLERGRNVEHIKDYMNATKDPWELEHRGRGTLQMKETHPILSRDYPFNETNIDFWVNEKEAPYTEIKPYNWFRGYQIGGRSLTWGRQTYRWSDADFEANAKEGIAIDWPVRYKEIEPWYGYVEKFIGVTGSTEHIPHLPDGFFQPAMEMTCVEKEISKKIHSFYQGKRRMIVGRSANLTQPKDNRQQCQYRNKCWLGCPFGAYFSTQSSTLPAALATKKLTVKPNAIVTKILYDKDLKKATGVEVLDALTNRTYEYKAKIIFLNASTLNSAWVLMNSATDIWPDGLGSSSGELGHNLMDHHSGVHASGTIEGFEDKYYYGRRPNGIYIPRFRNINDDKRNYLRGFGYQGSSSREDWSRNIAEMSVGAALKEILSEPGQWKMGLAGYGEVLPYHENRISLDKNRKDKWGLPVLAVDYELKDNEMKMRDDMLNDAIEMLSNAGVKNISSSALLNGQPRSTSIHEMGTARMGSSAKNSVVNKHNQVWDALNVFVTDGAFMTSASCVNPSLTYMAFTARAADFSTLR